MTLDTRTVAIVEDDDLVRSATASLVRSLGLQAIAFSSAEAFLQSAEPTVDEGTVGCIISDVQMPGISGLDLQEKLRSAGNMTPMILMTAYPTDWVRERALANGAYCFLEKPCNPDLIANCLEQIFGPLDD